MNQSKIHILLLASLSALSISAIEKGRADRPKPAEIHPSSQQLHLDIENCKKAGCKPIFGTTEVTLKFNIEKDKDLKFRLHYENCHIDIQTSDYKKIDNAIRFTKNSHPVDVICDNNSVKYNRISFLEMNNSFGMKLRKIENTYSHLGYLTIGVIFMPSK